MKGSDSVNPRISVVTVCYNAVDIIETTILSVINQTYDNIEYIVIDGASKDGTLEVIEKYRDKISCLVSEPDKGIYDAMNKAIGLATGQWISFMNAGDVFHDTEVIEKICFIRYSGNGQIGCIYGDYVSRNKLRRVEVICDNPFYERPNLIKNPSMGFHHQSCFVRTDLAKELLFDNRNYRLCADFNMIYQIYKKGYSFEHVPFFVAVIDNSTGASAGNRILQLKEHYQVLGLEKRFAARLKVLRLRITVYLKKILFYDRVVGVVQRVRNRNRA